MTPQERAVRLQKEADELLRATRLTELCRPIGPVTPTGSYYMNLMMYPDIDVYLPPATPRQLFEIAATLAEEQPVIRVNFLHGKAGPLQDALYIKPVIAVGEWERPWKIDIWAVQPTFIETKNGELDRLRRNMTPAQRERILAYKFSVLNEEGRTPMYSGIYIYQAVIEHGLTDFVQITEYLRGNEIEVSVC